MRHLLQGGITSWKEQERLPRFPATRWKSPSAAPATAKKCHACIGGEKKHVLLVKGEGHVGDAAVVSLPEQTIVKASAMAYLLPLAGLFIGMLLGALIAPQSETAGSAIGGVIGLAAALIGLKATEKKRSESGEYAPKLLRVISAADALKN